MKLLIKGGTLIDGSGAPGYGSDLYVEQGIVKQIAVNIELDNLIDKNDLIVIDATGKLVVPGLIDIHVHLREPGHEAKETVFTGTRAAAKGGFTAVACMPNTEPAMDSRATVELVKGIAAREGITKVYPIGAITRERKGENLCEFGDLKEGGAVALSDDGNGVMKSNIMRMALEYSKAFNLPLICHCEDRELAGNGVMHEGYWSVILGLPGISALAEEIMINRDIELARLTKTRIHIAHVSTRGSVEMIKKAKAEGVQVSAEVAPHHLVLTDEAVKDYEPNTKVNPPLREKEDVAALIGGLQDGTIDLIATDHAPHTSEEKNQEYFYAPFGITGLETVLGLAVKVLVEPGYLTWEQLVAKMSTKPAQVLNIPGGSITLAGPADITVIDPGIKWTVDKNKFVSQGKNTPFHGWELVGQAVATIVAGRLVMEKGLLLGK